MALVDYRGFRLIAMSLVPINESTIVYGSNLTDSLRICFLFFFHDSGETGSERN
jgi:hypothetical protein